MLHATELLGAETYDSYGNFVGRVKEMFIEPAEQPNRIARLLLSRGQYRPLVARYDQVGEVAPGAVKLTTEESALEPYRANDAWLGIQKDLLDQQIIDTGGRKVVRVNDVDLNEQRTNGNVELRVAQVDVGLTGATRRLLQGLVPPKLIRRIQAKLPPRVIPYEFCNVVEPNAMRRVKLRLSHDKLEHMHPADLADIMEELSREERESIMASLDHEAAAEALAEMDDRLQRQIVEKLDPGTAADILEEMPPDEAADVLAELPPERSQEVLREMQHGEAQEVRELLRYQENTAGGMMNTECVVVKEEATRQEVVEHLKAMDTGIETIDTVIVVNGDSQFSGVVRLGRLLLAQDSEAMNALKLDVAVSVQPEAEDKEVFQLFDKYNLRSLTVVDQNNRPVGAITVDDVVNCMYEKL